MKKILLIVGGIILVIIVIAAASGDSKSTQTQQSSNTNSNSSQTTSETSKEPEKPKGWVTVMEASGNANKKTASFELKGGQQKITYTFNGTDPYVVGGVYLMKEGSSKEEQGGIPEVMVQKAGTDETIARKSSGTYYLDVSAANASWTVKIEEER